MVKKIWWVCLTLAIPATLILSLIIWLMDQGVIAIIFFCSAIFWFFSMFLFSRIKKGIEWFGLSSQLALLILSFVTCYLMGGILDSGGVIFFGLVGPVYALVFPNRLRAILIFGLYLMSLVILGLLEPIEPIYPLPIHNNLILFIINFIICSIFWFAAIYFFARQRTLALKKLQLEEIKTNNLLLNILPEKIAESLKEPPSQIIADKLENVSILFADLVGFTEASVRMPPDEIILFLNKTFTYFDELTNKYDLEKIKTIGDCYMAAAGAPVPDPKHAHAAARMALDIQHYAKENQLKFRIGIHSGSVVAGVIGVKKFSYDLWGDTVNLASRLETEAPPGGIYISENTCALIQNEFHCESIGWRELKGFGKVMVWRLDKPKDKNEILASLKPQLKD